MHCWWGVLIGTMVKLIKCVIIELRWEKSPNLVVNISHLLKSRKRHKDRAAPGITRKWYCYWYCYCHSRIRQEQCVKRSIQMSLHRGSRLLTYGEYAWEYLLEWLVVYTAVPISFQTNLRRKADSMLKKKKKKTENGVKIKDMHLNNSWYLWGLDMYRRLWKMLLMAHDSICRSTENEESPGKSNWCPSLQAHSSFVPLKDAAKSR